MGNLIRRMIILAVITVIGLATGAVFSNTLITQAAEEEARLAEAERLEKLAAEEREKALSGYYVITDVSFQKRHHSIDSIQEDERFPIHLQNPQGYLLVKENQVCQVKWDMSTLDSQVEEVQDLFRHFKPNGKSYLFQCLREDQQAEFPWGFLPFTYVTYELTNSGLVLRGQDDDYEQVVYLEKSR